jgi:hypothetical protein
MSYTYHFTLTFGYCIKKQEIIDKFQVSDPGEYELEVYTNPKTGKQIQEKKWLRQPRKYFVFENEEVNSKFVSDFDRLLLKITTEFDSIEYDDGAECEYIYFYSPLKNEEKSHYSGYPIDARGTSLLAELESKLPELQLFGERLKVLGFNVSEPEIFIRTKIY